MAYAYPDYTCTGCGAGAVTVKASLLDPYSRVWVPHAPGCPVAAQVADARSRALARREAR